LRARDRSTLYLQSRRPAGEASGAYLGTDTSGRSATGVKGHSHATPGRGWSLPNPDRSAQRYPARKRSAGQVHGPRRPPPCSVKAGRGRRRSRPEQAAASPGQVPMAQDITRAEAGGGDWAGTRITAPPSQSCLRDFAASRGPFGRYNIQPCERARSGGRALAGLGIADSGPAAAVFFLRWARSM